MEIKNNRQNFIVIESSLFFYHFGEVCHLVAGQFPLGMVSGVLLSE